ncbi:DNA repair protein RecN [Deltaproteobacteria bacterium]|nr:DNA repair protein RecN [Deltaproteobacteria bacterium]
MLEYLRIRNLALIENMELEFSAGMNVLTGETGAGKSFILKALGFLLGDRLSCDMVRPGALRAQVEALFTLENNDIVIRRELSAETGRSRLYVNDALKSQETLRKLRDRLVSHTSQHTQQQLLKPSFQAKLIDSALPDPQLLHKRDALYRSLADIAAQRKALLEKQAEMTARRDLLEMQQQEIDKVSPKENEEERLEALRAQMRSSAHLCENYEKAFALLHGEDGTGLLDLLDKFEKLLAKIGEFDTTLTPEADAVSALRVQLAHLGCRLRPPPPQVAETNMHRVEERLFALAQLRRKLRKTLPEILALRKDITEALSFLDVCALDISRLLREEKALTTKLKDVVDVVIPLRRSTAKLFAGRLEAELRELGFSHHVMVIPDFLPQEIWSGVNDESVRFLWAPNPGQPPQPLDRIASGGELSRFLLALVRVRQGTESATYIFDEVDAGVGGLILNNIAEKLNAIAEKHQMILITHWPQLASRAKKHFQVNKEVRGTATFTLCTQLNGEERLAELSRMAGGGQHGAVLAQSLQT